MSEQIATARLDQDQLAPAIRGLAWGTPCYMYLEQVPTTWIGEYGPRDGLQLCHYRAETPFDAWQRGRVFNQAQELKWEMLAGQYHAVYCGPTPPAGFTAQPVDLTAAPKTHAYFAWGKRLDLRTQKALGVVAQAHMAPFLEGKIARVLDYPVSAQATRMQIHIREWYGPDGRICYSRWFDIREWSPSSAPAGAGTDQEVAAHESV